MSAIPTSKAVEELTSGNAAFRNRDYGTATAHYFRAIGLLPELVDLIETNVTTAREKFRRERAAGGGRLRVGVCGWELAHNAAGRAYILAKLYEGFAQTEIIGCLFPKFGREVWEPIRRSSLSIHTFTVVDAGRFIEQAIELVVAHPYDLVHLSKPRAPNILLGALYKLIWNAKVIVDVDDEELAFVRAKQPLDIGEHLKESAGQMPVMDELTGLDWTRLAVGLVGQFDGVTVSNPELQKRYGGSVIPHARDEKLFHPSEAATRASRIKYGVPLDKTVVLFFGTPRRHKGLTSTALAIAAQKRKDLLFVVVGDFDDLTYKQELAGIEGVECHFIGNQPFDAIPEIASLGDFCILLQRPTSDVSRFQAPAKVSDALAMGMIVLAGRVPPLRDFFDSGACIDVSNADAAQKLAAFLADPAEQQRQRQRARDFFLKRLSFDVVATKLRHYADQVMSEQRKPSAPLDRLFSTPVFPEWMPALRLASAKVPPPVLERPVPSKQMPQLSADVLSSAPAVLTYDRILQKVTEAGASPELLEVQASTDRQLGELQAKLQGRKDLPLVSVVMPTFNRAQTIAESISTVVQQNYPNWELLVCDDGSADATREVIERFADARIRYELLPRGGAAAARNAGLARARGAVIAYLDSDNFWHPKYLSAMVATLMEHGGHSAVYSDFIDFQVNKEGGHAINSFTRPPFNHEALLDKPYIDLNSFVHRRELYDTFGGFNAKLSRRQDYDLILKYTWLRDPLHLRCALTLYQRNDGLNQITKTAMRDRSPIKIINEAVQSYFDSGLPMVRAPALKKVSIISWDLCRNHFSKPYALAEALSSQYEVQLVSFRFFKERIFPPLRHAKPKFETVYLQGSDFPDQFAAMAEALDRIDGDLIYVVKPRLPSLGLALLANQRKGTPLVLEINDLESVVADPAAGQEVMSREPFAFDAASQDLLSPYSDHWSHIMEPLAKDLPVLTTHNENLNRHFGDKSLYIRNIKDERVYDPARYDRAAVRANLGFAPDDRVILFGGLLRKHKGIYELVELLQRLNDPRYKLLFVGSRPTPDQYQLIEEHGDLVKVLPPQDRESMAKINLAADLVILWLNPEVPASHYQFPYKASDALAMGTPIIVNDIADMGSLARQGYMIEVPFADWDAMTNAVRKLFDDKDETERLRAAGRRLFRRQFSYAAARTAFALAAQRALDHGQGAYPVAEWFANQYEGFRSAVMSRAPVSSEAPTESAQP